MITKNSRNILIADDSAFFREKLKDILTQAGHKVLLANDGLDIIKELNGGLIAVDLLVLDLQMPVVSGFNFLEWLHEKDIKIKFPVLVMTGAYESVNIIGTLKKFGVSGLMRKDSSPEEIIFRVNRTLFSEKSSMRPKPRVPACIPVDFSFRGEKKSGSFLNISETGAFLHTDEEMLTGAVITMEFALQPEKKIRAKGTIRWSTGPESRNSLFCGHGVMFENLTDEDRAALATFVEDESRKMETKKIAL